MKVPTGLDAGLGQILPDAAPTKQQTLRVPGGAFGGTRASALGSLAQGIGGIGSIVGIEERKSEAKKARQVWEEAIRAEQERADEIASEKAEEALEKDIAQVFEDLPTAGDKEAPNRIRDFSNRLPKFALDALGTLSVTERGKLEPLFSARIEAARGQLAVQQKVHAEAEAQAARNAKLERALNDAIAAKGDAQAMGLGLALIDDVVAREARDQGLTPEAKDARQQAEEEKFYGGVFDSLLQSGKAVTAEQFFFNAPDHIWDVKARAEREDILLPALTRENAKDSFEAILASAPDPEDALKQAKRIRNLEVRAHVIEALETNKALEERAKFDARAQGFNEVYRAISDAAGDPAAVSESQWQQLDGKDSKGKAGNEVKAVRKLAKRIRAGDAIETDWPLYFSLIDLSPKEFATLPIWNYADKLNRSEFLLIAERQQQTRAALASGAPVSAAGAPGSLDAQLAALAKAKGWDSEAHTETRGLYEREIRAEIAEAVEAMGGQSFTIAERCKLINEAAADMATFVPLPSAEDDTLNGGAGTRQPLPKISGSSLMAEISGAGPVAKTRWRARLPSVYAKAFRSRPIGRFTSA